MAAATAAPYFPSPFVTALLVILGPYFSAHKPQNGEHHFTDIVRTLSDYGARTRAEMLHAAQVLAFGFSTLETLAETKSNQDDLTPALRIRFRNCATALHKAALNAEKSLQARLSCDVPATSGQPKAGEPSAPESADLQAVEALQQANRRSTPTAPACTRLPPTHPGAKASSPTCSSRPRQPPSRGKLHRDNLPPHISVAIIPRAPQD